MPLLSELARRKKIRYFLDPIPKDAVILEVGCGSGWVGEYLKSSGWTDYLGIDLIPPADVVGDIRQWEDLGMEEASFDYIVAFEVVEHVEIYSACEALLKPGGRLLITTPVPHCDWIMETLERLGLNQKRTSPHSNLHYLRSTGHLELKSCQRVAGLSQWGILTKGNNMVGTDDK